jgi:hypothetical protein
MRSTYRGNILLITISRWVYKRIFVADGNFKADHIRQRNSAEDALLSEGSGMMPRTQEYMQFLASAIERLTVSISMKTTFLMPVPVGPLFDFFLFYM